MKSRYQISPCKDCEDRYPICHDSCVKYQEWHKKAVNHKESYYKKDGEIINYKNSKIRRQR